MEGVIPWPPMDLDIYFSEILCLLCSKFELVYLEFKYDSCEIHVLQRRPKNVCDSYRKRTAIAPF
jgi:hypothetical protein